MSDCTSAQTMKAKARLLLHCDVRQSTFCLGKEGEKDWRQYFPDLRAALDYASKIVTEETPIAIYNELGRMLFESLISPRRPG